MKVELEKAAMACCILENFFLAKAPHLLQHHMNIFHLHV